MFPSVPAYVALRFRLVGSVSKAVFNLSANSLILLAFRYIVNSVKAKFLFSGHNALPLSIISAASVK